MLINLKNNWKYSKYYVARYFGYSILYYFIGCIIFILAQYVFRKFLMFPLISFFKLSIKDVAETMIGKITSLPFFICLFVTGLYFLIYITKKSLAKTFFKPYKNFILTPKFEKITYWFAIKLVLISFIISFALEFVLNLSSSYSSFMIRLQLQSLWIPLVIIAVKTFIYDLFILKYFVEKYATISDK